jgi:hypothetical protein
VVFLNSPRLETPQNAIKQENKRNQGKQTGLLGDFFAHRFFSWNLCKTVLMRGVFKLPAYRETPKNTRTKSPPEKEMVDGGRWVGGWVNKCGAPVAVGFRLRFACCQLPWRWYPVGPARNSERHATSRDSGKAGEAEKEEKKKKKTSMLH